MLKINEIYNENCLEGMKKIDNKSIDFIFTDLPFSTTQNSWDIMIPFDSLWEQYERIIKDNGCIALWAQSPFDKNLLVVMKNYIGMNGLSKKQKQLDI